MNDYLNTIPFGEEEIVSFLTPIVPLAHEQGISLSAAYVNAVRKAECARLRDAVMEEIDESVKENESCDGTNFVYFGRQSMEDLRARIEQIFNEQP